MRASNPGNKEKILHAFFLNPSKGYSLRELERAIGLGLPSVTRYVRELTEERLVRPKDFGRIRLHYADTESRRYRLLKSFHNIQKLYDSGAIEFINERCGYPTIILFGSRARGEDREESDWDIYVDTSKEIDLERFRLGEVQIIKGSLSSLPLELANNIINGIKLEGYVTAWDGQGALRKEKSIRRARTGRGRNR